MRRHVVSVEFVLVPVPPERVLDVYALLAGDRTERRETPSLSEPPPDVWRPELVERAYRESPPGMKQVFDYLAQRAGKQVAMEELARGVRRSATQVAGVLGAFGRRHKNRYQIKQPPFEAVWDHGRGMVVYQMSPEVAEIILGADVRPPEPDEKGPAHGPAGTRRYSPAPSQSGGSKAGAPQRFSEESVAPLEPLP
jgi:hypothetical protein